ncbi:MAG: AsnC family transcriptional regulator [Spirochaetia bacterium]|nr:AsnC family transcriptional regulator [Spirochaetia bacterium]
MDDIDRYLLDFIQNDLPEEVEPFFTAAQDYGISQEELFKRLRALLNDGYIRRISALLSAQRLGYHSTLVAVKTTGAQADLTAARINRHPGVSHNYLRDGDYNIWFTLTIPGKKSLRREVEQLLEGMVYEDIVLLPSLRLYKLRVHLPTGGSHGAAADLMRVSPRNSAAENSAAGNLSAGTGPAVELDERDKGLLKEIQEPFPLVPRPWDEIGRRLGISGEEVVRRVHRLKQSGIIRRISGALHHRNAGYSANGMACFQIAEGSEDEAGGIAAAFPEVSHCYLRDVPERLGFPLFAMIHAKDKQSCSESAVRIAEAISAQDYKILFSTKEYKKVRTTYKPEDI